MGDVCEVLLLLSLSQPPVTDLSCPSHISDSRRSIPLCLLSCNRLQETKHVNDDEKRKTQVSSSDQSIQSCVCISCVRILRLIKQYRLHHPDGLNWASSVIFIWISILPLKKHYHKLLSIHKLQSASWNHWWFASITLKSQTKEPKTEALMMEASQSLVDDSCQINKLTSTYHYKSDQKNNFPRMCQRVKLSISQAAGHRPHHSGCREMAPACDCTSVQPQESVPYWGARIRCPSRHLKLFFSTCSPPSPGRQASSRC